MKLRNYNKLQRESVVHKGKKKKPKKRQRGRPKGKMGKQRVMEVPTSVSSKRKIKEEDSWMLPESEKKACGNKYNGRKVMFAKLEGKFIKISL